MTLGILLGVCRGSAGTLDPLQSWERLRYQLPRRWDNVERPPVWVAGRPARYASRHGLHAVELPPGEAVTVALRPGAALRVKSLDGHVAADGIEVSVSDGTPLFRVLEAPIPGPEDSFEYRPGLLEPGLARVSRPARCASTATVALFVTRDEPLPKPFPYRDEVPFDGASVDLRRGDELEGDAHWRIDPDRPETIRISGPARIAIRSRLVIPPGETRTRHPWQLVLRCADGEVYRAQFEGDVEKRAPVFADGETIVASSEQETQLELDEGEHLLTATTSQPGLFRIIGLREPDYLLPGANGPGRQARDLRTALSRRDGPDGTLSPDLASLEESARALAHDNQVREGPLEAVAVLRRASLARPDHQAVRRLAREIEGAHTFYRDLLPVGLPPGARLQRVYFRPGDLLDTEGRRIDPVAAEQHLTDLLRLVPGTVLTNLPVAPVLPAWLDTAPRAAERVLLHYELPPRVGEGRLRVLVAPPRNGELPELRLSLEGGGTHRLIADPSADLPWDRRPVTSAEAALTLVDWRGTGPFPRTLGALFAAHRQPAVESALWGIEIPLPAGVNRVRIESVGPGPLALSLQSRASRSYELGEMAYRREVSQAGTNALRWLTEAIREPRDNDGDVGRRGLTNDWTSLVRLVQERSRRFRQNLLEPATVPRESDPKRAMAEASRAREAASAEEWLEALEAWKECLLAKPEPRLRREAFRGRVDALEALDEPFLLEDFLASALLFEHDGELRQLALDTLLVRRDDPSARLSVRCAMVEQEPTEEHFVDLVAALESAGHDREALQIALCLPPALRPAESVLSAALRQKWWVTFEAAFESLRDAEAELWRARLLALRGEPRSALERLRRAGPSGPGLAQLEEALAIRRQLESREPSDRAEGILRWERLDAGETGHWRDETLIPESSMGARLLVSPVRDVSQTLHLASPGRPATFLVAGPATVEAHLRPLHEAGNQEPVDGWGSVWWPGELEWIPFASNLPSPDLEIVGDPSRSPGRLIRRTLTLGPGLHRLRLSLEEGVALVALRQRVTALHWHVLPPRVPETVAAVLSGASLVENPVGTYQGRIRILPMSDPSRRTFQSLKPEPAPSASGSGATSPVATGLEALSGPLRHRMMLRLNAAEDLPRQVLEEIAGSAELIPPDELPRVFGALGGEVPREYLTALEGEVLRRHLLSTGATGEALSTAPRLDTRIRMELLARLATEQPRRLKEIQARAEWLGQSAKLEPESLQLLRQLLRDTRWTSFPVVLRSAGLRRVPLEPSETASRDERVIRALALDFDADRMLLGGTEELVLRFEGDPGGPTRLRFSLLNPDFLRTVPVFVSLEFPGSVTQTLRVGDRASEMELPEMAPPAAVRIWQPSSIINQLLAVGFTGADGHGLSPTVVESSSRDYHVATETEPLRMRVEGPAVMRIDEYRSGGDRTRFLFLAEGDHDLAIPPPPGAVEGLYRVFHRVPREPEAGAGARPSPAPGERPPLAVAASPARVIAAAISPELPLGGQEDGTWSYTVQRSRRQIPDEDVAGGSLDESWVVRAEYGHLIEEDHLLEETGFQLRRRDGAGSTLGVDRSWTLRDRAGPTTYRLAALGFLQQPSDGGLQGAGRFSAEARQRRELTPMLRHEPSVETFWRLLSLEDLSGFLPGAVDQDVFTGYKQEHPSGLSISDRLVYRPWLDTELWTLLDLTTNPPSQGLSPDNVRAGAGWRQLLGDVFMELRYQLRRFMDDAGRAREATRSQLRLDVELERTEERDRSVELGLRVLRDLELRETTGMFFARWTLGNGRGYHDRVGVDFEDLKVQRANRRQDLATPPP